MRKALVLLCGALILALLNYTIYSREQLVANGQRVFLELAPVDPRSLMQGDYMSLRFSVAGDIRNAVTATSSENGYVVLRKDERGIGHFLRLDRGEKMAANKVRMLYRQRHKAIQFATDAFFFQEGKASLYEAAKYGEFRVSTSGESILVSMRDADLQLLGEATIAAKSLFE